MSSSLSEAVKLWCWKTYQHQPWFCGCVVDKKGGVELRKNPEYKATPVFVQEKNGIKVSIINFDPDKHGPVHEENA